MPVLLAAGANRQLPGLPGPPDQTASLAPVLARTGQTGGSDRHLRLGLKLSRLKAAYSEHPGLEPLTRGCLNQVARRQARTGRSPLQQVPEPGPVPGSDLGPELGLSRFRFPIVERAPEIARLPKSARPVAHLLTILPTILGSAAAERNRQPRQLAAAECRLPVLPRRPLPRFRNWAPPRRPVVLWLASRGLIEIERLAARTAGVVQRLSQRPLAGGQAPQRPRSLRPARHLRPEAPGQGLRSGRHSTPHLPRLIAARGLILSAGPAPDLWSDLSSGLQSGLAGMAPVALSPRLPLRTRPLSRRFPAAGGFRKPKQSHRCPLARGLGHAGPADAPPTQDAQSRRANWPRPWRAAPSPAPAREGWPRPGCRAAVAARGLSPPCHSLRELTVLKRRQACGPSTPKPKVWTVSNRVTRVDPDQGMRWPVLSHCRQTGALLKHASPASACAKGPD